MEFIAVENLYGVGLWSLYYEVNFGVNTFMFTFQKIFCTLFGPKLMCSFPARLQ